MKRFLVVVVSIMLMVFCWIIYLVDEAFSQKCEGPGFDILRNTKITSIEVIILPEIDPNSSLSEGITVTLGDDNRSRDDSFSLDTKFIDIEDAAKIQAIKSFILEREGDLDGWYATAPHGAKYVELWHFSALLSRFRISNRA
ncbi:hypothetical protein [Kiloniella sp.]|uniref:hypothetical protein n=1 Tax=Kiloniella sp. TaxID=1938587 RepID=UPI003B0139E3